MKKKLRQTLRTIFEYSYIIRFIFGLLSRPPPKITDSSIINIYLSNNNFIYGSHLCLKIVIF